MERLTTHDPDRQLLVCSANYKSWNEIYDRLAYYEDLDEQGRLVVLPCKVGEHLYATECGSVREVIADLFHYDGHCLEITYHYNHFWYVEGMGVIGKTVFLSREDAEKALKGVSEDA